MSRIAGSAVLKPMEWIPHDRKPAHILPDTKFREHLEQSERLIANGAFGAAIPVCAGGRAELRPAACGCRWCLRRFLWRPKLRGRAQNSGSSSRIQVDGRVGRNERGGVVYRLQVSRLRFIKAIIFQLRIRRCLVRPAPIFDTKGGLAAVLDVSLLRGPSPKASQNLAMTLVTKFRTSRRDGKPDGIDPARLGPALFCQPRIS